MTPARRRLATTLAVAIAATGGYIAAPHHDLPDADKVAVARTRARARQVSYVHLDHPAATNVVSYWNTVAGWELFRLNLDPLAAQVKLVRDPNALGGSAYYWENPCRVVLGPGYESPQNWTLIAHEVGHCLGFHDHTSRPDTYQGPANVGTCRTPALPADYNGILAYCSDVNGIDRQDDRDMLVRAGLATAGSIGPSPTIQPTTPRPLPSPSPKPRGLCRWFRFFCR